MGKRLVRILYLIGRGWHTFSGDTAVPRSNVKSTGKRLVRILYLIGRGWHTFSGDTAVPRSNVKSTGT